MLYSASESGDVSRVQELIGRGADVSEEGETDGCVQSSLMIAARNGHVEVVRMLAEAQANVDQPTDKGATPLFVAAKEGHVEVARLLVDSGADINKSGTSCRGQRVGPALYIISVPYFLCSPCT